MSAPNWYFFYQKESKESEWTQDLAQNKAAVLAKGPAFITALELTGVPEDGDWSKVSYRGPMYFDFDADGDIEYVINQAGVFLAKLEEELQFDLSQLRMFASGGKGFHIEIPPECFVPKVSKTGYKWLPYIYREVAQQLMVDTLDLNVYTGKRGRQWRVTNVKRENGNYKVQIKPSSVFRMTPEDYAEVVSIPCTTFEPDPPVVNAKLTMLFDNAIKKAQELARNRKKKSEQASKLLDPWKKAHKHPPTIVAMMKGERIDEEVGFQRIATQLAIYATSVGIPLEEFLDMCQGLCESHKGDSYRYAGPKKRRQELRRMYEYMESDMLYVFDPAPMIAMLKKGVQAPDLGLMIDQDDEAVTRREVKTRLANPEGPPGDADEQPLYEDDEDAEEEEENLGHDDLMRGIRVGVVMNKSGIFKRTANGTVPVCRAYISNVDSMVMVEGSRAGEYVGFEIDLSTKGMRTKRVLLPADTLTSSTKLKQFFSRWGLSFQGTDAEVGAIMDILSERASKRGVTYIYPREGFFVIQNPTMDKPSLVTVYLTQTEFISSLPPEHENYFTLKYQPDLVKSSYNIDLHNAPRLGPEHANVIKALLSFTIPSVVVDTVGWFVAAHYRSIYLHHYAQFPSLQAYGEAGSGKTKTVERLGKMHWYMNGPRIRSAMSGTNLAVDTAASTSHSAPFIIDEYKPRELRVIRGRLEKIKDLIKAAYVGSDIGDRGTVNKGAGDSSLATIRSQATAPIVFMGEALEMETAIMERSVNVCFKQEFHSDERAASFEVLKRESDGLSALGRAIVELGFKINHDTFVSDLDAIIADLNKKLNSLGPQAKRIAPRVIYNRAVILHGMKILKAVLSMHFGDQFDKLIDSVVSNRVETGNEDMGLREGHMSEISKVISRMALMTYDVDAPHEIQLGKDYTPAGGGRSIELRVARCFDQYRRFCAQVHETPLFDTMEAFSHAILNYSACVDKVCGSSILREEGSNEIVVALDTARLREEGVRNFRQA